MPDILHDFPIDAPVHQVFQAVTEPAGLDAWWTQTSAGAPTIDSEYELRFGPGYHWQAKVTRCVEDEAFELLMVNAADDWCGTRIGFGIQGARSGTQVRFSHRDWTEESDHFRTSSFCWAMYLRLLKRYVEDGEIVPYDRRLDA